MKLSPEVSRAGFSALSKLKSLQEFIFYDESTEHAQEERLGLCFELLPQLHVSSYKPTPHLYLLELSWLTSQALSDIEAPCSLQVRHLALHSTRFVPRHVALPELQVLFLVEPLDGTLLLNFSNLSELNLRKTDKQNLLLVLGHVGRQLQTLRFNVYFNSAQLDSGIELDRVLKACPNLSELSCSSTLSPWCASELRPDNLRRLRRVSLDTASNYVRSGIVLQLLRLAPELRFIRLAWAKLSVEDLRALDELARQRTCMRNLEDFAVTLDARDTTDLEKQLIAKALTSCVAHCDQLKNVSLVYFDDSIE